MIGVVGGLLLWLRIPATILNSRFIHVGNGKYGSKIGLLVLLILPLFSLLGGINQDEFHADDETERVRLEEERKKKAVNTQICYAIGESILVLGLMLAGGLFW